MAMALSLFGSLPCGSVTGGSGVAQAGGYCLQWLGRQMQLSFKSELDDLQDICPFQFQILPGIKGIQLQPHKL